MRKPTVYIYHKDINFIQTMKNRLNVYGIEVIGSVYSHDFRLVVEKEQAVDCLLLQVDLDTFQTLKLYGIFEEESILKHVPVIALVNNDSLYDLLSKSSNAKLKVFHYHILLEKLVIEILNLLPFVGVTQTGMDHVVTLYGALSEIPLHQLLDYTYQTFFTGRIIVQNSAETGSIELRKGKVEKIRYKKLSGAQALQEMCSLREATFHLEQKLYNKEELEEFLADNKIQLPFTLKDLLIDVFYFMYQHLVSETDEAELVSIIKRHFTEASNTRLPNLYVIYLENAQEKIHIIGEIENSHVGPLLGILEEIYNEAAPKSTFHTFKDFINSLDELKPYLAQLSQFSPIFVNGSTKVVL